ncbi:MAG: hypothetical protein FWC87_01120 [Acidimicrobiaceae bacterium]|nr:hypothetical protein [Acidimicrobiaceae bacterium]
MPTGTGAAVLSSLPEVPYVIDPATFASMTENNDQPLDPVPTPGPGNQTTFYLPRAGVGSLLKLKFVGNLQVLTAGPAPGQRWPYGFLSGFKLSAGLGADTWDCNGLDLDALKQTDLPFVFGNVVDQFPGAVGGDATDVLAVGNYPLYLSYEIPIAVDQTSLIGSLFLQSSSATVSVQLAQELTHNLQSPTGASDAAWVITGQWYPEITVWDIPVSQKGELILPEVNRIHMFVGIDQAITGTGRQPAAVQRTAGVLQRLFLRSELSPQVFLSALPSTAPSALIDQIQFNYGLVSTPRIWNPASTLAEMNQRDYGAPLPYDTYVIDTLKRNPSRDAILLQGVTNLQALMFVNPAVDVQPGAYTRVVEEILI